MSTVTADVPDAPVSRRGTGQADAAPAWITANVRPAGSFGRADVGRLRDLLGVLAASASLVVLDLAAMTLRSGRAADAIDEAGWELERRGGCLLCINADDDARARLGGCRHAVVVGPGEPTPVP
ncbi:hypothetical protein [Cellulomonas sp. P5_C5]